MEKKKKSNPILFGLVLIGAALSAIWQNEHRFDYYKAARDTTEAYSPSQAKNLDTLFSLTGSMDQQLHIPGDYVEGFTGYLEVTRSAEIFAWEYDKDDDGASWTQKWMSYVQNNERNKGLRMTLRSRHLHPDSYQLGDLSISADDIQLIEKSRTIPLSELTLSQKTNSQGLTPVDHYYYLTNGGQLGNEQLGDQRLSFRGRHVPAEATYFGRMGSTQAVPYQADIKSGLISGLIQNKGILHHLVRGDRETALHAIKEHLSFVKNIVRVIGLIVAAIGGGALFSSLTRFLLFIPGIGYYLNQISGWIGMVLGFVLGLLTLCIAFLTSHPIALAALAVIIAVALYYLITTAMNKRKRLKANLEQELGYSPSDSDLKELEYIKLYQLFASDGEIAPHERKKLDKLTSLQKWDPAQVSSLETRAASELAGTPPEELLNRLILITLADGHINRTEIQALREAADKLGISRNTLALRISQLQRG